MGPYQESVQVLDRVGGCLYNSVASGIELLERDLVCAPGVPPSRPGSFF